MAALTASGVALYPTGIISTTDIPPNEWFPRGKDERGIISRRFKLTLTGQGGQTNTIGASVLGFKHILECSNLFDDTNNVGYPAVVDPIANVILLLDGAAAPAPVDVGSGGSPATTYITVTGTVKGPTA